jgi:Ca-activated chloride channel family protein
VPYRLSILLEIRGKDTISSVDSPSHPISVEFEDDSIKAEFTSGAAAMDRDFVLTVHYKTLFQNRGYFFSSEKGNFFQLDLCPVESDGTGASSLLKEVVFLLDCSGSMEGSSIQQAKTALEIFLKALMEGVRFNLFRFGSSYEKLFPEGMPYSGENLKKMLNWLKEVDANLGGTEVLGPLKEIYQQRVPDGYSREVILITDGQIGNESEIMDLIRNGDRGSRLFTVGIGYGPNEYFIRQLTRVAGGTSELIAPGERIEPKILRLFRQVMSERMDDLRINWDSSGLHAKQAPFNSSLFTGESVSVFARTKEPSTPPKEIKVSFRKGKGNTEWSVPVQEVKGGEVPLHLLWAKERIRDLEEGTSEGIKRDSMQTERREKQVRDEIIHLSRDFGILSRETSFVATEKRIGDERTTGEVVLRKVPVMLTRGWGGVQVNMAPTMAMPAMMARPSATQFSMRRVLREHASQMKPAERFEASEGTSVSFLVRDRGPVSRTDELGEDILMNILSLQRVEGGFEIDEGLCEEIGVTVAELKKLSRKIKTTEKADGFILLSTAILLQLLNRYFIDREGTWKSIVEKTEKWFMRELSRTEPRIDGIPLGEWAVQFVSTHSLRRMP